MRIIKTIGLFFLIPLLMKQLTKSGSFLWDDLIGLGCATNDETTNEQTIRWRLIIPCNISRRTSLYLVR